MEKTLTMSKKRDLERLRESQRQWDSERASFRHRNIASQRSKSDYSFIRVDEEEGSINIQRRVSGTRRVSATRRISDASTKII